MAALVASGRRPPGTPRLLEPPVTLPAPPPPPGWPTPLAAAAFHGVAGEIIRLIEPESEADPAGMLIQLLVGAGSAIGRGPHFLVESTEHHASLFAVLTGATASARKGTSWDRVRPAIEAADPDWAHRVMGGISSGEGLIWAVRNPITKTAQNTVTGAVEEVVVDGGENDKRLLAELPEFAGLLRVIEREGNTLSVVLRQGWDSGRLRNLTKNSPIHTTNAHVSVIGHVTAEELRRYLTRTETANGFANRFLWVAVRRTKLLPEGGRALDLNPCAERLRVAIELARTRGRLVRDPTATRLWREVYPRLTADRPGLLGKVLARGAPQVMRVALVYALLDCADSITEPHLEAALAVWGHAEASATYLFGTALGDPVADEIAALLMARPGGALRSELRDHFGRNRSSDEIGRALGVLVTAGRARASIEPPEGGRGRPAERWRATGPGDLPGDKETVL